MTTTTQSRQREMEELASSLSETLSLHFPDGASLDFDDELVKRWLKELAQTTPSNDDMAKEVVQLAVHKWKQRDPDATTNQATQSTATVTSFSLLDQLSAMPAKRIFYNDIQGATTAKERLDLLQQVDHVDDVAPEWDKVLQVLLEGLAMNGDYIGDYIQLHSKWFQQCQASSEYTSLQYGLCWNLIQALRQYFGHHVFVSKANCLGFTATQQLVYEMMQQWHIMWMAAATKFSMDDATQMACSVMQLMRSLAPSIPYDGFVLLPAHFLALVDPFADWFAVWIHRVASSPSDGLACILSSGLFHDLLDQCHLEGRVSWKTQLDATRSDTSSTFTIVIPKGHDVEASLLDRALWHQSLCVLRSVLVHVRVALFPWSHFDNGKTGISHHVSHACLLEPTPAVDSDSFKASLCTDSPPLDEARRLIGYFVRALEDDSSGEKIKSVCMEAIETILYGLRDDALWKEYSEIEVLKNRFPSR